MLQSSELRGQIAFKTSLRPHELIWTTAACEEPLIGGHEVVDALFSVKGRNLMN